MRDPLIWEFDVGVSSHALLREGVTVHHYRRVEVVAGDFQEARLIACQMAALDGAYVTCAHYLG